ncbi:MAG: hypothetical protein QOH31_6373 [Verrucomicrobiota bacterium]|jgi:hypothetical protein
MGRHLFGHRAGIQPLFSVDRGFGFPFSFLGCSLTRLRPLYMCNYTYCKKRFMKDCMHTDPLPRLCALP